MIKSRYMSMALIFSLLGVPALGLAVVPANIIIDFGDVLGEQSTRTVLSKIGFGNIFANIFSNPLRIEEEYMDFLSTIESYKAGQIVVTNNDKILPKIMCDWLQGLKTPAEVRAIITAKISETKPRIGKRKAKLWVAITNFMFTPDQLASVTIPKKSVIKIIKRCHSKKGYTGLHAHKIYLLTNFDQETFELIRNKKEFKELFDCFDGIIVSGKVHLIKPDPQLFHVAFKEFNINPDVEFTVFIDDEYFNIEAAMRLGKRKLRCIQFKGSKDLKKILKQLGVI
jgi:hypothetical protein